MNHMTTEPVANEAQRKLFFALVNDGGWDSEEAKEKAKQKFGLQHFTEITSKQISQLIDLMQNELAFREPEENTNQ